MKNEKRNKIRKKNEKCKKNEKRKKNERKNDPINRTINFHLIIDQELKMLRLNHNFY